MVPPRLLGVLGFVFSLQIVVVNVGFTRTEDLAALDANCFSTFGQVMIIVWGIAYLMAGIHDTASQSPIWFAFAVQKACSFANYVFWHQANGCILRATCDSKASEHAQTRRLWLDANVKLMGEPQTEDYLAPLYFTLYGIVDVVFLVLFFAQCMAPYQKSAPAPMTAPPKPAAKLE